jgi:hypothetical protein
MRQTGLTEFEAVITMVRRASFRAAALEIRSAMEPHREQASCARFRIGVRVIRLTLWR